jgi:hypothetical protein
MTDEPARYALVEWEDGTLSWTDISLLDKAGDGDQSRDSDGQAGE